MEAVKNVRVAIVQASSVIMDKEATLKKTLSLIQDASKKGANIVVFPEAFIPAYPRGLSFGIAVGVRTMEGRKDFQRYYENSVLVPGPITDEIGKAAHEANVYVTIGVVEKEELTTTLYCTVLFFSPTGELLGKHRKIKPTAAERCIWGEGDGSTLTVVDTPYGKMGSLICWENYMPLARAAMYNKGVKLYIAPTADPREIYQCTLRHIAVEGRCFVLSCNQYYEKSMYPKDLNGYRELENLPEVLSSGGSCIIDPFGNYAAGPLYNQEGLLIADLDLGLIVQGALDLDIAGHYSRPDIFQLTVNEEKR